MEITSRIIKKKNGLVTYKPKKPIVAGFTNTVIIKSPAAIIELKNSKPVEMQF